MPSLRVGRTEIDYALTRRANLAERRITVTPGAVKVLALDSDGQAEVDDFLHRKRQWLFDTLREMEEALAKRPVVPRFMTGSKVPFRGRKVSLTVRRHDGPHIEIGYRNGLIVDLPPWVDEAHADVAVATEIKLWLKRCVRRDVHQISAVYSKRFGLKPTSIRLSEFVTGWGSCTRGGTINIDWRLVFAPKRVLEYVVVHEMAHLRVRTHGPAFWETLAEMMPDYEGAKGWLESNGGQLDATFLTPR
jgi:predicted metal-dependent hydrolase